MSDLSSRGMLSVEEMNALFENRLRANVYDSNYRIVRRGNSFSSGVKVYGHPVSDFMTFGFQFEGQNLPIDPLPAQPASSQPSLGSRAN
jgi:hypothetical protein